MLNIKKYKVGLIFIWLGIILLTSYWVITSLDNIYKQNSITKYFSTIYEKEPLPNTNKSNDYIGVLQIPKINLEKGFYDPDNINNNVNKNIMVLENSQMPDKEKSILAIASHSGNGLHSYFTNLDKLNMHDQINIYYDNVKYVYEITSIYNTFKNGHLSISKKNAPILVLTTCNETDKTQQLVIVSELSKKEYSI